MKASELLPNAKNWRKHPPAQEAALKGLLSEVGYADALLARETPEGLVLIDGHLRAETTPDADVPVLILDLTEEEADKVLLTLDPLAAMAEANKDNLSALMEEVSFSSDELNNMMEDLARRTKISMPPANGLTDPDTVPEPPDEPISKLGDLWLLGGHRLLCGDSTKAEDVGRLMAGEKAALMATDPPYLVNYQGDNHPESWQNKATVKDKHWDDYHDTSAASDFFYAFLAAALPHLDPDAAVYQWHAILRQSVIEDVWNRIGLHVHQVLIWVKSRSTLTRSHYMWQHEPALYGWLEGHQPSKRPPVASRSVWEIDQKGESDGIHPTQKPVEIFSRPIEYHTERGDVCYEPFSGSGTQIVAAERLGRRCYAVEMEPRYVDVAVLRWEEFTGEKAVRDARS